MTYLCLETPALSLSSSTSTFLIVQRGSLSFRSGTPRYLLPYMSSKSNSAIDVFLYCYGYWTVPAVSSRCCGKLVRGRIVMISGAPNIDLTFCSHAAVSCVIQARRCPHDAHLI